MPRIFAAIKFQPSDLLTEFQYRIKNNFKNEKIKWVELHNLHLTLKFFGEIDESKIPLINRALNEVAEKHTSFPLKFNGAGIFGSKYNPRVIWLGIEENPQLMALEKDLLFQLDQIGFKSDRQNFVPHLTLGRIRHVENKPRFFERFQQFKNFESDTDQISEFHLYESKLLREGPRYSVLQSFLLT